jgi:CHAT domain-containing protein
MVTRLLEQRQLNARAAGTELGDQLDKLRGLRRRLDQLLQDTTMKPDDRDKLLVSVADDRDRLEREVVAKMPTLRRWQALDELGPADLLAALPPGAVLIDVIRYTHFEYVDRKEKRTPSYVAFVLAKGRPVQRIELDAAAPIDRAVGQWRTSIEARQDEAKAAAELQRLVWDRIATAIPPGTTTLYLTPDGDLARLPWAALPVGGGQVLLEKYALAQVPHGTWLLDQLMFGKKSDGADSLLTVGGVDYGPGTWTPLPGTAAEARAIAAIAPGRCESLSRQAATADALTSRVSQAGYVHLATHGEFKADELTAEQKRAAKARASWQLGDETRKVAAKNPLGYVGLVLANGEVLSGLGIVDLPLSKTRLVTLSACETGLGELTGGEGVQGLQRAFHLAGCPNVVASLWKVNDAATAALMAKFYHELWVAKKPPIEALREAQLTIYQHPELIPDLAGERGALKLKDAAAGTTTGTSPAARHADTKLWAAFVLSGAGR